LCNDIIREEMQEKSPSAQGSKLPTPHEIKQILDDYVIGQTPAKKVLAPIAAELKKIPNDVIIDGHTDNVPIKTGKYSSNWELSMARAYSVLQFMQEQGISSKHLAGIGYGENRPAGDNATPEGRAKNRRIEISLMKTD